LFADDLKAYSFSKNTKDFEINLQEFIIKLEKYAEENSLKLSAEKTSLLHIGPKNPLHTYTLNNQKIKTVSNQDSIRDLGVYFSHDLKWEKHIKIITNKANQTAFTIIRNLKTNDPKILIELYKIYVLPIIEFASPVFNPYLKKDIEHLEQIQKTYLRIIYNRSNPRTPIPEYQDLLKIFKIDSLQIRRLKIDFKFFHKILHGEIKIDHKEIYSITKTNTRGDEYKFFIPARSNQISHNSFFVRTTRLYSQLPISIRKTNSKIFKTLLDQIDLNPYLSRPTPVP